MEKFALNNQLRSITDRFLRRKTPNSFDSYSPPFDVSKPNQHDDKQEFLAEQIVVSSGLRQVDGLLDLLAASAKKGSVSTDLGGKLTEYIDQRARLDSREIKTEFGYDIVRRSAADVGLSTCLAFQLIDLLRILNRREVELLDQEVEFWSGKSRPPNHYARTIALRFARYIANNTAKKPTFGTSSDGGHPSTEFGRALEEVFELLEIKANVKNAAVWAIAQLTEADVRSPVVNAILQNYSEGSVKVPYEEKRNAELTIALKKQPKK